MSKLHQFVLRLRKKMRRILYNKMFFAITSNHTPISTIYGIDRGMPIDRYYIDKFLVDNKHHIKGHCLELLNNEYTIKYGGVQVLKSDILDINPHNTHATIIADIRAMHSIPDNTFDCIILTQVLQFIDTPERAISECYRILKPQGVLLISVPAASRIDCVAGVAGDFWRFTKASMHFMCAKYFTTLATYSYGNAMSVAQFILGFATEELSVKQLTYSDENFPCIITVVAQK